MHPGAPVDIRTHLNIVCIKWQIHNNKSMVLVQENKGNVFGGNLISNFFFSSLTHVHLNILTCGMKDN